MVRNFYAHFGKLWQIRNLLLTSDNVSEGDLLPISEQSYILVDEINSKKNIQIIYPLTKNMKNWIITPFIMEYFLIKIPKTCHAQFWCSTMKIIVIRQTKHYPC